MKKIQFTKENYDSYVGTVVLINGVYCLIFEAGNVILFSPQSYEPGTLLPIPCPFVGGLRRDGLISNNSRGYIEIFAIYDSLQELFKHYPTIDPVFYIKNIKNLCNGYSFCRRAKVFRKIIG